MKFDSAFETADKKHLLDLYIQNAINNAYSSNENERATAVMQLAQFDEDKAVDCLITLLSKENNRNFQYLIIAALNQIVQRRIKKKL